MWPLNPDFSCDITPRRRTGPRPPYSPFHLPCVHYSIALVYPASLGSMYKCSLVFLVHPQVPNKNIQSRFKKIHQRVVLGPLRSPRGGWAVSQRQCSKLKSIYQGYITLLIFCSVAVDLPISKAGILAATRLHMLSLCFLRVRIGIPIYREVR